MGSPSRSEKTPRVGGQVAGEAIQVGRDPELERFERSLKRSRERRAARRRSRRQWRLPLKTREPTAGKPSIGRPWRQAAPVAAILAGWWLMVAAPELDVDTRDRGGAALGAASGQPVAAQGSSVVPAGPAVDEAWDYARERGGLVSLAVIDSEGRMHSFEGERAYVSASVVKALLMAAELQRLEASGAPLDSTTRTLLTQMITVSDNNAANTIYYRVGDAGLYEVARRAGMQSFTVSGYWANAQITAEDMARFMWRLDEVLAGPHREFGLGLLAGITGSQRWGIPQGAGDGWSVRFKGGWRSTDLGQLVHQAAELRTEGARMALAVLTDGQPSQSYAIETLRGVGDRLAGPLSREPWDGRWDA
jgi:Beta-lactamase enzyme family